MEIKEGKEGENRKGKKRIVRGNIDLWFAGEKRRKAAFQERNDAVKCGQYKTNSILYNPE